jgi:hypothetical protein
MKYETIPISQISAGDKYVGKWDDLIHQVYEACGNGLAFVVPIAHPTRPIQDDNRVTVRGYLTRRVRDLGLDIRLRLVSSPDCRSFYLWAERMYSYVEVSQSDEESSRNRPEIATND